MNVRLYENFKEYITFNISGVSLTRGGVGLVEIRFGDFFTKNTISEPLFAPRPS